MGAVEEVRSLEEKLRMGDASPAPDTSSIFDELLADDVLFVQPGANSVGKAGVLRSHQAPRKRTFSNVEVLDSEYREVGSTVAVACKTTYSLENRKFSLRTLRLWKREAGSWKVAVVAMMEEPPEVP